MIVVHLNINQTQGIVELILTIGLRQNDFSANKWHIKGREKEIVPQYSTLTSAFKERKHFHV
jgi:hypothetical protein